jgi:hypothetical protein
MINQLMAQVATISRSVSLQVTLPRLWCQRPRRSCGRHTPEVGCARRSRRTIKTDGSRGPRQLGARLIPDEREAINFAAASALNAVGLLASLGLRESLAKPMRKRFVLKVGARAAYTSGVSSREASICDVMGAWRITI